jgi:hypothetical protein
MTMNIYRKTHKDFFFSCAYLRHTYGLESLSLEHILSGRWLSEGEIADFTVAYMMGGEL